MARFFIGLLTTAALLLTLEGCSTQELPEAWEPLTTVVERGSAPGISDTAVTTISPYLYVSDLDWFNERYPEGSIRHEALRRHELQHALEQEEHVGGATGVERAARLSSWVYQYLTDKNFRWEVEKKGYKEDILYKRSQGIHIFPQVYAGILSGKTYDSMVSYEAALAWVQAVLRGI